MSFYNHYQQYKDFDFESFFSSLSDGDILRIISKDSISELEYLALLSEKAEKHLEIMAQKANRITVQQFGKVVFLFAPMYLANYCVNQCAYCGFNVSNGIERKKLAIEEVEAEAKALSATGIRHIIILTGESRSQSSVTYMEECVAVLKKYFSSISIEVYPLETSEYSALVKAGTDGFTLFQETYDEEIYDQVHLKGPKKNYRFRLDAPERACMASFRTVTIGALLGLNEWRREAYFTGLHAHYLQNKYSGTEISISLPRMRPHVGCFEPKCDVSEKNLVQIMLATRLYMRRLGITISTRERPEFRDNLIGLGVTKMSAGVSTEVGGYAQEDKSEGQFDISDCRSVEEMREAIYKKGYQPVFMDWQ